jgi:hypothetical protein
MAGNGSGTDDRRTGEDRRQDERRKGGDPKESDGDKRQDQRRRGDRRS